MYFSTRNDDLKISASEAILKGISEDGGLFLPYTIPTFLVDETTLNLSYQDLAYKILKQYFDDFEDFKLKEAINKAYSKSNFANKIYGLKSFTDFSFLELSYGPTLTFKDMALSLFPYLMEIAKEKNNIKKRIKVLTATSGDTGSAVLSNFSNTNGIDVIVLYPNKGVSKIQEKQMLSFTNSNSRAYALKNSNFDDCQTLVKKTLNTKDSDYVLTSANSINIGRLLPQIVYYYALYVSLVNEKKITLGAKIDVIVPTGNFGNIFSCYLAKKMGLPIDKLICASNENSVLTDFFKTGIYDENRKFIKTNSPSMDILLSSNLERLLYLIIEDSKLVSELMSKLKEEGKFTLDQKYFNKLKDFVGYSINPKETLSLINSCFKQNNYLIDPHTSVAYGAYLKYNENAHSNNYKVIVSTASPYKFPETIAQALDIKYLDEIDALKKVNEFTHVEIPSSLENVIYSKVPISVISKKEYKDIVLKKVKLIIKTPATSANIGCAFDVAGIALNLYNTFSFMLSNEDEVIGFNQSDSKDNLILKSYQYLFNRVKKKYLPIKIELISANVPEARGLGSSATCIISGILAANYFLGNLLSKKELITIASEIEGHPDNVAACLLGNLVTSFSENGIYTSIQYEISKKLHFILCISDYELLTSKARNVLPQSISYSDAKYNLSRIINLPSAMQSGDLVLLKDLMNDKFHTPYRMVLIPSASKIKEIANKYDLPFAISGAGSSLLIISYDDRIIDDLNKESYSANYRFVSLKVDHLGATIKEIFYE